MTLSCMRIFSVAEDTKFAECYKCKDLVACGGDNTKGFNTSNLVQHLKSKHSEEYSVTLQLKQKKETERASTYKIGKIPGKNMAGLHQLTLQRKDDKSPWDINDSRAHSIHKKLGEMIAIDSQLISIVENPGFINFVKKP